MMHSRRWTLSAVVGALGVVYGDIGTSPLYAFDATLTVAGHFNSELVLGALSLILWALTITVTIKYVSVIMRADNEGEGGILAMFALAQRRIVAGGRWAHVAVWLALAGTAFFFCDSLITPAITVLSAVEGMEVLNPGLKSTVVPITVGVIIGLFAYQRRGTARIGSLFGPIMVVWFLVIGLTGAAAIRRHPPVLAAINPLYGIELLEGVDAPASTSFAPLSLRVREITSAERRVMGLVLVRPPPGGAAAAPPSGTVTLGKM